MMRGLMTTPQQQQAETADNRNINVSGGEYVLDADTVRYLGIQKIRKLHEEAKQKMQGEVSPNQPKQKKPAPMPPLKIPGLGGAPPAGGGPSPMPTQTMGLGANPMQGAAKAPNQVPKTPMQGLGAPPQPQTNFAAGGYVAPVIPKSVDFKEIQNYYANMNKNSNVPKTQPYITSTGGLAYRYVDPKTGNPIETSPVRGSSTYDLSGKTGNVRFPSRGGRSGDNDMATDVAAAAGAGLAIPIAGALLKEAGVGNYIKEGVKDLLGLGGTAGTTLVDSSLIPPGLGTLPYGVEESFMVPYASDPSSLATYSGINEWAAANPGTAAESGLVPGGAAYETPSLGSDVLGGGAGIDALGTGAASEGASFLGGGSIGADAVTGSAALAETGAPIGLEALGGAEGFFAGTPFSATAGGVTGALGGLTTALGYAAPALILAQLGAMYGDTGEDWQSLGSGTSVNLGDLKSVSPELKDMYAKFIGDKSWLPEGADLSRVGSMNFDYGKGTGGREGEYFSMGDLKYDTLDKAIQSGRESVLKRLDPSSVKPLDWKVSNTGTGQANEFLKPEDYKVIGLGQPVDWGAWTQGQDRRNSMGTGEGAEMYRPLEQDAFYQGLDDEAKRLYGLGWNPDYQYAFTRG